MGRNHRALPYAGSFSPPTACLLTDGNHHAIERPIDVTRWFQTGPTRSLETISW